MHTERILPAVVRPNIFLARNRHFGCPEVLRPALLSVCHVIFVREALEGLLLNDEKRIIQALYFLLNY